MNEELIQALMQSYGMDPQMAQMFGKNAQAEMQLAPLQQEMLKVNTFSRPSGHAGNILEGVVDAVRRPKVTGRHNEALMEAMGSRYGMDQLQAQLEAMQRQREEEELASLHQQARPGVNPAEARLRARGEEPAPQPEVTDWQRFQQNPEQFKEFKSAGKGPLVTNTVNPGGPQVGTIPQGFELRQDKETGAYSMQPIPGGPAELEQQEAQKKAEGRQRQTESAGHVVLRETSRALDLVDKMHQGDDPASRYWRAGRAKVKGTPEEVLMTAVLQPMKAELGFQRIQTMRMNSPTGGSLGNVSNFEVDNLQKTAGLFDADMPLSMLKENIVDLRHKFLDAIHGTPQERAQLVEQGAVTPEVNAQIDALYQIEDQSGQSGTPEPPPGFEMD